MKIVKTSGHLVDFNPEKLRQSLLRSGAHAEEVDHILQYIQDQLYEGISTRHIYKLAFAQLKKSAHSHAARYNLRQGIQQLGPAGFFFEKFVARLFEAEGFQTQCNLTLQGHCVTHEIDVLLLAGQKLEMVECKFHGNRDTVTDVKVPMYILSRFHDLQNIDFSVMGSKYALQGCWIVTNNRFSADALQFGRCMGLQLLSWDEPAQHHLRHRIENHRLYPLTCLTTLTQSEKEKLLIMGLILVRDLIEQHTALGHIDISPNRVRSILAEAYALIE